MGQNILSSELVMYQDGTISKQTAAPPKRRVFGNGLTLCKTISGELAARFTHDIGMGRCADGKFHLSIWWHISMRMYRRRLQVT